MGSPTSTETSMTQFQHPRPNSRRQGKKMGKIISCETVSPVHNREAAPMKSSKYGPFKQDWTTTAVIVPMWLGEIHKALPQDDEFHVISYC